ncbi:hypothetical protein [Brachybacterium sp. UMB0905]|uniref:hypothetical protein n=1 Tax=Brachybacterium sp. UMB0905 TaxID=2069310 RepID=UPI0011AF6B2F|nr:hypothetical protein [Brachybacterium sp. UMB0905]
MSSAQARAARIADLYWVTQDMARIALDASTDVPETHLATSLPTRHALLLFSSPLPPVPYLTPAEMRGRVEDITGDAVATDGLLWRNEGDQVIINALSRSGRATETMPVMGPLADGATVAVPAGPTDVEDIEAGQARAVAAFLHSVVTLMAMPTVASVRDVEPSTGESRPPAAGDPVRDGEVRLIDLRPMRHLPSEDERGREGREYRHRWVVRGHWRQQAVGPKRGQRETIWVPSYIKGPAGAPMLHREDVMVWRR